MVIKMIEITDNIMIKENEIVKWYNNSLYRIIKIHNNRNNIDIKKICKSCEKNKTCFGCSMQFTYKQNNLLVCMNKLYDEDIKEENIVLNNLNNLQYDPNDQKNKRNYYYKGNILYSERTNEGEKERCKKCFFYKNNECSKPDILSCYGFGKHEVIFYIYKELSEIETLILKGDANEKV